MTGFYKVSLQSATRMRWLKFTKVIFILFLLILMISIFISLYYNYLIIIYIIHNCY